MRILYPLILILFTVSSAFAQIPIEVSKEMVKIEGKNYYVHHVKKKETLYSLSKAYGVTTDMIVKNNSAIATGLKEGTIIYIPIIGSNEPESAVTNEKKQKKYKRHTVKWYEDIADISEKYDVPVEAIIALNNLPDGKLKARQVIQIPDAAFLADFAKSISSTQSSSSAHLAEGNNGLISSEIDSTATAETDANNLSGMENLGLREKGEPLEIALVLPLNTASSENLSPNFMDFYAGALLAVKDFKEKKSKAYTPGSNELQSKLIVNIYDLSEYSPLHTLSDEPGFERNQLIIGPARASHIKEFLGYATTEQIPLVSPLDNNAEPLLDECQYLIQVPTPVEYQLENIVDELKSTYMKQPAPVLLVSEKSSSDASYVAKAQQMLDNYGIPYHNISYGILDGRTISETMLSLVDTLSGTPNLAIIPSNSEAFVSDALRNLDICHNYGNTKIKVFGMPKWRNFETINIELYHKVNLHLSIPYFVDYNSPVVENFLLRYRALYNTEPTPYAYQGYDITNYFLKLANEYGKNFINLKEFAPAQMLQSNFEFKLHNLGIVNCATRNIIYNPDYTVTLVK
ncbi:MAG: LysM peptidoglycan-binding domain-containing protein [Bacteroidales bacterium]|nr:LysM peptidoglycan-binding domain-containing protein [Bacteroidales bacterium]